MNQIYDSKSIAIFRSIQFWHIKSVCSNRSGPIYVSELDSARRGIHIWCIKSVCWRRPIYDCELDSAHRGIHIWRIKSVCSNRERPIYDCELDAASNRVLTFAHEHFFCAKKGCFDVPPHSTRWRR